MIKFIDCNYPGVVYIGTAADMADFNNNGSQCYELTSDMELYYSTWVERDLAAMRTKWAVQDAEVTQ